MGRVWRQKEDVKDSLFPNFPLRQHLLVPVRLGIVLHYEGLFIYPEGKAFKEFKNLCGSNGIGCCESVIIGIPVDHAKEVELELLVREDMYVFFLELPAGGLVSAGAAVRLVSIEELDSAFIPLFFKFLQLFALVRIELRRGYTSWTFSYTSISCANKDKKRLKVDSVASCPLTYSQAALAALRLCRIVLDGLPNRFLVCFSGYYRLGALARLVLQAFDSFGH